jgi:hypothetical protein
MKRLMFAACALIAGLAQAQLDPTNYFTQAVLVTAANTNSGVTGLVTGKLYLAIAIDETTNAQYTAASQTNDIRALTANLVRFVQARTATNDLQNFSITDQTKWTPTSSNVIYLRTYRIVQEDKTYYISE